MLTGKIVIKQCFNKLLPKKKLNNKYQKPQTYTKNFPKITIIITKPRRKTLTKILNKYKIISIIQSTFPSKTKTFFLCKMIGFSKNKILSIFQKLIKILIKINKTNKLYIILIKILKIPKF